MFEVFIDCFLFQPLLSLYLNMVGGLLRAVLLLHLLLHQSVYCSSSTSGPVFIQEPPNYVDFSNTTGTKIICQARGVPLPNITWTKTNGEPIATVPGLRQVRASRTNQPVIASRNLVFYLDLKERNVPPVTVCTS